MPYSVSSLALSAAVAGPCAFAAAQRLHNPAMAKTAMGKAARLALPPLDLEPTLTFSLRALKALGDIF